MGLGLVQVYSSSYIFAIEKYNDGFFFIKKQFLFSFLGILMIFLIPRIPFKYIKNYSFLLWILASFLMALTFVPGMGIKAGGATRWLSLFGGLRFEPAELMKIGLVAILSTYIIHRDHVWGQWKWPMRVMVILFPMVGLLLQPDFGSFVLCLAVVLALSFAFGLPWKHIITSALIVIPSITALILMAPYRRKRIFAFLDPWSNPDSSGFQLIQSMMSFHSGGLTGEGLGEGQGKLFFLPEAHTDFTLAVLGEEMGYIGFLALLALYALIILRGFQISFNAKDTFLKAFSLGLTIVFGLSVFTNVGVVLGLLPTKGLTLPFMSYGGSSLISMCFLLSLLLNAEAEYRRNNSYAGR